MATHWDNYWQQGAITSFSADYDENYEDVFLKFWLGIFKRLEPGSELLDLATGNLALPLIAAEADKDKSLIITATDLSKISKEIIGKNNKRALLYLEKIRIVDQTPIENLSFEDNQFDLITSMYGFEYADLDKAIKNIASYLKPGKRFVAISHWYNSSILKRNKLSIECLQTILFKENFFSNLQSLSKVIGMIASRNELQQLKSNKKATKLKAIINKSLLRISDKFSDDFVETGIPIFMNHFFNQYILEPVSMRTKRIKKQEALALEHLSRLNDLKNAAFDKSSLASFRNHAQQNGLNLIKSEPFIREGEEVGVELILEKAS